MIEVFSDTSFTTKRNTIYCIINMDAANIRLITFCKVLLIITNWKIEFLMERKILINRLFPLPLLLLGQDLALVLINRFCRFLWMRQLMSV